MVQCVSRSIQHVLVCGGVGPKDKDYIFTPLFTFLDKFPSDSFRINISYEVSSKIGNMCAWEVAWSSIINVNDISGSKNIDSWISNCGDWGPCFVDEAKPGKGESESVNEVEEIFAMLL